MDRWCPVVVDFEEQRLIISLEKAAQDLEKHADEIVIDFSSVRRIGTNGLKRMEALSTSARGHATVVLKDVCVDVYRTLKLLNLNRCFSFVN
ncbi:MAG TPA: hypothetical protein VMX38_17640 [Verrucomicrobiae bacterium]|nr:hypothetical protein [Verrucomicrobiae bacterium]